MQLPDSPQTSSGAARMRQPWHGRESWSLDRPLVIATLVVMHVVVAVILVARADTLYGADGVARYSEIASEAGRPYRDFDVEYPVADLPLIELVAGSDVVETYRHVVITALVGDLLCALAVTYGWGFATAGRYLLSMIPLLFLIFVGDDVIWLALTAFSLALMRRGHEELGGAALGLAALGRIWPLILVPTVVFPCSRRAVVPLAVVTSVGLTTWLVLGGIRGPEEVLGFRGAHGWEVESLIGATIWIISGRSTVLESGAPRLGHIEMWHRFVLGLALVIGLVAIGRRTKAWIGDVAGVPAIVAAWLVPWIAIASAERSARPFVVAAVAVVILTGVLSTLYVTTSTLWLVKALVLARGAPCLAIVAGWFWATRRDATPGPITEPSSLPAR
jgi:hypothetical protein